MAIIEADSQVSTVPKSQQRHVKTGLVELR